MRRNVSVVVVAMVISSLGLSVNQTFSQSTSSRLRPVRCQMTVDFNRPVREIPPGVVGWGAMWKRSIIWPAPPQNLTNKTHAAYIRRLAAANKPLMQAGDVRHISWPWGVGFSTFGVNWENSAKPWSQRTVDCVRGSGWCEKAVVGVGDLIALADAWELEAITVAVPLAVYDGYKERWRPRLFHDDFTDATIEKIADHAKRLVAYMKKQRGWGNLKRVYLSAGCEWRKYRLRNPSSAVLTYAKLIRRLREVIQDDKVWIVACASDSADIPREAAKAASWNRYLYERLNDLDRVVLDLHRYRGMIGTKPVNGKLPLTPENIDKLLRVGVSQRGFLVVDPAHWNAKGRPMPSILLENAIHGHDADHKKKNDAPMPWPVVMAHADLVREALASPTQAFLGWTWFPENLPPEWPHGAIRGGKLSNHAVAQGFLSKYHRGRIVNVRTAKNSPVRGNAAVGIDGSFRIYGGNFSRQPASLTMTVRGASRRAATIELLGEKGKSKVKWDGKRPIHLKPMSLWRLEFPAAIGGRQTR